MQLARTSKAETLVLPILDAYTMLIRCLYGVYTSTQ
jgi:hypothetical protein